MCSLFVLSVLQLEYVEGEFDLEVGNGVVRIKSVSRGSSFGVGLHHVPTAPIWHCGGR